MRKFFLFFLLLLSGLCIAPSGFAQESVQVKPNINYTANRPRYILAGLTIDGIKGFDDNLLLSVSGLTVGETYEVPGPEISEAIMRYWQQKLFSLVFFIDFLSFTSAFFMLVWLALSSPVI